MKEYYRKIDKFFDEIDENKKKRAEMWKKQNEDQRKQREQQVTGGNANMERLRELGALIKDTMSVKKTVDAEIDLVTEEISQIHKKFLTKVVCGAEKLKEKIEEVEYSLN